MDDFMTKKITALSLSLLIASLSLGCQPGVNPVAPPTDSQDTVDDSRFLDSLIGGVTGAIEKGADQAKKTFAGATGSANNAFNEAINSGKNLVRDGEAIVQRVGTGSEQLFFDIKSGARTLLVDGVQYAEGEVKNGKVFVDGALRDTSSLAEGTYSNGRVWVNGAWQDTSQWVGSTADLVVNSDITQTLLDEITGRKIKGADWILDNIKKAMMDVHFHTGALDPNQASAKLDQIINEIGNIDFDNLSPEEVLTKLNNLMGIADDSTPGLVFELNYYATEILVAIVRDYEVLGVVDKVRSAFDPNARKSITDPEYLFTKLFEHIIRNMLSADEQGALSRARQQADLLSGGKEESEGKKKKKKRDARAKGAKANLLKHLNKIFKAYCTVYGPVIRQTHKGNGVFMKLFWVPGTPPAFTVNARPGSPNTSAQVNTGRQNFQLPPDKVAIKAKNGRYLAAELGDDHRQLTATRTAIGQWETYMMENLGGSQVALKAHNGLYIATNNGNWEERNATLKQIAVGGNGLVIGVNPDNKMYKWNGSSWDQVVSCCNINQVSISPDGQIWGVYNQEVYQIYLENGGGMIKKPGGLKWVEAGPNGLVMGIGLDNKMYKWNGNDWNQVVSCCNMDQISISPEGQIWGVYNQEVYQIYLENGGGTIKKSGRMKHIQAGPDGQVWGVNPQDEPFEYLNGFWRKKVGGLKQIDISSDGTVWGVSYDNKTWQYNPNGVQPLAATALALTPEAIFEKVDLGNQQFALKASNGKYVSYQEQGDQKLYTHGGGVGALETFTLETSNQTLAFETKPQPVFVDNNDLLNPQPFNGASGTEGIFGTALQFDGQDDYAEVAYSKALDVTNQMTLSAWVNLKDRGGQNWKIIARRQPSGNGDPWALYSLNFNSNNTRVSFGLSNGQSGGGSWIEDSSDFPLNQWTHVAGTWDGSTMRLYINGQERNSSGFSGPIGTNKNSLYIGRSSQSGGDGFNGAIDQLFLLPEALSAQDIQNMASAKPRAWSRALPLEGRLSQLSINPAGEVWGLSSDQKVWKFNPGGPNWVPTTSSARLKQISAGGNGLTLGVAPDNRVFKWSGNNWEHAITCCVVTQVSVGPNGDIWAVDERNHNVYKAFLNNGGGLIQQSGQLKQVSVGGNGQIWGLDPEGDIMQWDGSQFKVVAAPNRLIQIHVSQSGEVWGVNGNHSIFKIENGQLKTQPGFMKNIATGGNKIWGLNNQDQIFEFK